MTTNMILINMWKLMEEYSLDICEEINDEILCTICKKLMIEACYARCGCRYCSKCIKIYLNKNEKFCPGITDNCQDFVIDFDNNIYIDQVINMKISKLTVKCPSEICNYKNELGLMVNHIKFCDKKFSGFLNNNIKMKKDYLDIEKINNVNIITNESPTKLLVKYFNNLETEKNIEEIKKNNVHLKKEIENLQKDGEKKELQFIDTIKKLKDEVKQKTIGLKNENRFLKKEIENLKLNQKLKKLGYRLEIKQLKQNLKTTENKLIEQLEEMKELHQRLLNYENEKNHIFNEYCNEFHDLEINSNFDKPLEKLENIAQTVEINKVEIFSNIMENVKTEKYINLPEFWWEIDNYYNIFQQAKMRVNTKIISEAFYTHKNGYKLSLKLYPDGYGLGKGTHMAVFFFLMFGEHDDELTWPFTHDVSFDIIDQQTRRSFLSKTLKYSDFKDIEDVYQKPEKENNKELGDHKFIDLDELLNGNGLIENDKIIIKCTVDILL